tara:strand:+ start:192 stop:326 length:135 start_codon:yes stop_codon:yes gene_type:complete
MESPRIVLSPRPTYRFIGYWEGKINQEKNKEKEKEATNKKLSSI